jgi:hypothetical protein
MRQLIAGTLLAVAAVAGASAGILRCDITSKFDCRAAGCKPMQPAFVHGHYNLIDLDERTFARCDEAGCGTWAAELSRGEGFIAIAVPGKGLTATLNLSTGSFVEVSTSIDLVYTSFGSCKGG